MSTDLLPLLRERVVLLRALEDGWYGPHSLRSPDAHLDFAESVLPFVCDLNGTAALCSTSGGEVVFEIRSGDWEISVVLEDDKMYVIEDNVVTDELLEKEYAITVEAFKQALSKYRV